MFRPVFAGDEPAKTTGPSPDHWNAILGAEFDRGSSRVARDGGDGFQIRLSVAEAVACGHCEAGVRAWLKEHKESVVHAGGDLYWVPAALLARDSLAEVVAKAVLAGLVAVSVVVE